MMSNNDWRLNESNDDIDDDLEMIVVNTNIDLIPIPTPSPEALINIMQWKQTNVSNMVQINSNCAINCHQRLSPMKGFCIGFFLCLICSGAFFGVQYGIWSKYRSNDHRWQGGMYLMECNFVQNECTQNDCNIQYDCTSSKSADIYVWRTPPSSDGSFEERTFRYIDTRSGSNHSVTFFQFIEFLAWFGALAFTYISLLYYLESLRVIKNDILHR